MKGKCRGVCMGIVFIVAMAAFFSELPSGWTKGPDEVVISQNRDVATLDWVTNTWMETNTVSRCIFNTLVDLRKDYTYGGILATAWSVLDDLTWRFSLRKGVKFHNGHDFTAEDVKFTYDRIKSPELKSPWAWLLREVAEVKVIDPYTIEIKTTIPQPGLLAKLFYIPIVPRQVVKTFVNPDFGLRPVGTGPYKFVEWIKDERVVLMANEDYWGEKPKIKRVIFRPLPEASTRVAALLAGDIDVAVSVPPSFWGDLKKSKNAKIAHKVGTMVYCGLDALNPPMNNVKVRKAINHGVDLQGIIDSILEGSATRMNGPFHEGTLGYNPAIKPYTYDPKRAKQLLTEAGYPNGFETTLSFNPAGAEGATNFKEVAEAIAFQLKDIGIRVKLDPLEPAVLWSKYAARQLKMYFFTWPERWEPEMYIRALFHSKARGYYYRSDTADQMTDEGGKVFDEEKRKVIYQRLHQFLYDDAAWLYMYKQLVGFGVHKDLHFEPPHDGYVRPYEWSRGQ